MPFILVIFLFILMETCNVPTIVSILGSIIATIIYEGFLKPLLFTPNYENNSTLVDIDSINTRKETIQDVPIIKDPVKREIAKKFNYILELMNQERNSNFISIRKLAFEMGLDKEEELNNYFQGEAEPNFEFMGRFAHRFGINKDWFDFGEGQPFQSEETYAFLPTYYFDRIVELNPLSIYLVRSKSEQGEAGIILKLDDFKYVILPKVYNISSYIGGSCQLESFYHLIEKLNKSNLSYKCHGRLLNKTKFNLLFNGQIYPGIIDLNNMKEVSHWWDDFTDIYHKYPIANNYELWYGKEFIKAQEIVRQSLSIA